MAKRIIREGSLDPSNCGQVRQNLSPRRNVRIIRSRGRLSSNYSRYLTVGGESSSPVHLIYLFGVCELSQLLDRSSSHRTMLGRGQFDLSQALTCIDTAETAAILDSNLKSSRHYCASSSTVTPTFCNCSLIRSESAYSRFARSSFLSEVKRFTSWRNSCLGTDSVSNSPSTEARSFMTSRSIAADSVSSDLLCSSANPTILM